MRCLAWRRYICTSSMLNKDVMFFLFQSMCLVYWISDYDYMMLFIILGFCVSLNIICFHIFKLVWGRLGLFCRSLGARGERGARRGLKGCLDQPSFVKVWTILISETCLYILADLYTSTFLYQYVDGLLNPIHRKLSFTSELATPLGRALSVFISVFWKVSGISCHLGTLYQFDRTSPLPS